MPAGRLSVDPLFIGLTRPSLILGVSLKFAGINMMISMILLIQGGGLKVAFAAIVLHVIGYILSFRDPRFIEVFLKRNQKCPLTSTRGYFGGNSYGV